MMRVVKYTRHEFHYEPEEREAILSTFVYDVPHLIVFAVFPPLHILNQVLTTGGSQGGMSPGATWEPFELANLEYEELLCSLQQQNMEQLRNGARYARFPCVTDSSLSQIPNRFDWVRAISEKYRAAYLERQNRNNEIGGSQAVD